MKDFDIETQFKEAWGEQCEEFEPTCATCIAWQFYRRSGRTFLEHFLADFYRYIRPEDREKVDYPQGIKGDAYHYGFDDGYLSAIAEIDKRAQSVLKEKK